LFVSLNAPARKSKHPPAGLIGTLDKQKPAFAAKNHGDRKSCGSRCG
jgi:hypothetical protein